MSGHAGGTLAYARISFAQKHVDASGGPAPVTLSWRLTDSNPNASFVAGEIDIRLAGDSPGTYIGRTYQIQYDINGSADGTVSVTGTPQDSSYTYAFPVPQYANMKQSQWVVTKATAVDDEGETLSLSGAALAAFSATVKARELVDTTPATYDNTLMLEPSNPGSRPYVYDNGVDGSMGYSLTVQDPQSGFWKGAIRLTGPGGQTLHAAFAFTSSQNQGESCGSLGGGDDFDTSCGVAVTIPAGTAAGTWVVSAITLVNNAGVSKTYGNLNTDPIVVTSDTGLSASGFTASPNPVNDWVNGFNPVQITMSVTGAQQGISAIYVDTSANPCEQFSTTPTANPDGTVSVPVVVFQADPVCQVRGIAIVDGAGNVSLYGSGYNAPDPGLTITRVPDTTAPTATSASLTPASVPSSQTFSASFTLTLQIIAPIAPVNQMSIAVYDSSGNQVGGQFGGVNDTLTGQLQKFFNLFAFLPPGTYTVGFTLTDEGGLSTSYGTPGGQPVPDGPLQFTVTP